METEIEKKIQIFECKLSQYFNLHILNNFEKKNLNIIDDKDEYIPDFEQDVTKIINIYKVIGERRKEVWSSNFDEKTENFNLLWLFSYDKVGIYRISMDCVSKRLEHFVCESNLYFSDNNDNYINEEF